MLQRYVKFRLFSNKLDITKLDTFLVSPPKDRKVDNILYLMKDREAIRLDLSRNEVTLFDVPNGFFS